MLSRSSLPTAQPYASVIRPKKRLNCRKTQPNPAVARPNKHPADRPADQCAGNERDGPSDPREPSRSRTGAARAGKAELAGEKLLRQPHRDKSADHGKDPPRQRLLFELAAF